MLDSGAFISGVRTVGYGVARALRSYIADARCIVSGRDEMAVAGLNKVFLWVFLFLWCSYKDYQSAGVKDGKSFLNNHIRPIYITLLMSFAF